MKTLINKINGLKLETIKVKNINGDFYSFIDISLYLNNETINLNYCFERNLVTVVVGKEPITKKQEKEISLLSYTILSNTNIEIQYK